LAEIICDIGYITFARTHFIIFTKKSQSTGQPGSIDLPPFFLCHASGTVCIVQLSAWVEKKPVARVLNDASSSILNLIRRLFFLELFVN
jgi:hypothetical protein